MARLTLRPGASWKALDFEVRTDKKNARLFVSSHTLIVSSLIATSLQVLWGEMAAQLPPYARPLFLRIPATATVAGGDELMTGTFKHKKVGLRDEGFDIDKVGNDEIVLMRDDKKKNFVVVDGDLCSKIKKGEVRV